MAGPLCVVPPLLLRLRFVDDQTGQYCVLRVQSLFYFTDCWWFIITYNIDQIPSPWWERRELWEPWGVVWDIQIVFNAFIVMMLELGVDGAIRCGAEQGA